MEQRVDIDFSNKIEASRNAFDRLEASESTAHQISHDPWHQVGFVLITGVNSAYVLGYSGIIMVPLGWVAGALGLIASAAISFYANLILSRLHEAGGRRRIRYRDLAGHIYGQKMYYLTWTLQYINLFMINTGYIILAGQALKAIYILYSSNGMLKLPYCIVIAGIVCCMFAFAIPHLSALRVWLGVSTLFTLIYIIVALVLSIKDGCNSPRRDYGVSGSKETKIFSSIGAAANLVFAYNTGMLPEIQATVKPPYVKNMQKALALQFTAGNVLLFSVTFVGYWAYGSSTSSFLLNSVQGPKWVKTLANAATFLQTIIALHDRDQVSEAMQHRWIGTRSNQAAHTEIFASPMYEYLDTKHGRSNESIYSVYNLLVRFFARGSYLTVNTFVAALLPFLGDFMNLTGAVSTFPLTFVLANHMYIKVKGDKLNALQKAWHWGNVWLFTLLAMGAAVAAVRFIVIDSRTYHVFADL